MTGEVDPVSGTLRDGAGALATEIYSIEIDRDFKPIGPEKKMLGVADFAPSERRLIRRSGGQGFLLEGPRVHAYTIAGREVHLMLFSSRDYYHKNYTILAAVSHDGPQGHFELYRVHGKVVNLAQAIVDRYPVLRGVGRAYPFGNQGRRAILHAYRGDASGRSLLITDLDVLESADNAAGIEIRFNLERTP